MITIAQRIPGKEKMYRTEFHIWNDSVLRESSKP